jgi:hypothetical protein
MNLFELNVETWKIKKLIKMTPVHILFKMTLTYKTGFYINSSFLSNCTKQSYLHQSLHQGRKKQGNCVQGDYKHYEN